jgi:hypothetical protein
MSTNTRSLAPGSRSARAHNSDRCPHSTDSSWRACPKVNSRNRVPIVESPYTPAKTDCIPPERSTSTSSMLSAPARAILSGAVTWGTGFLGYGELCPKP